MPRGKGQLSQATSRARSSPVFLSSYGNTILNQSALLFSLGYFLNPIKVAENSFQEPMPNSP